MSTRTKPWSPRYKDPNAIKHKPNVVDPFPIAEPSARERQCTIKKVYFTPEVALRAAREVMERVPGTKLRPYTCPHCGNIHVGGYGTGQGEV